eukprot:208831-Rhodomonas_salina.11
MSTLPAFDAATLLRFVVVISAGLLYWRPPFAREIGDPKSIIIDLVCIGDSWRQHAAFQHQPSHADRAGGSTILLSVLPFGSQDMRLPCPSSACGLTLRRAFGEFPWRLRWGRTESGE